MSTETTETLPELTFIRSLLDLFARLDAHDELRWSVAVDGEPVGFGVNCSDLFYWGTADSEPVTPVTLPELRRAVEDATAAGDMFYGLALYCCRRRGMRPQHANYTQAARVMWPLFDACGPARESGMANPPMGREASS